MSKMGCPPKLLAMISAFHENMNGSVIFNGSESASFPVRRGVRQGCVLALTLFGLYFAAVLQHSFGNDRGNIWLTTRTDGSLFKLSRLKARTRTNQCTFTELLYADDAAIVSHSEAELQLLMDRFSSSCRAFGLCVSITKTKVMHHGAAAVSTITVNGEVLQNVKEFVYLGSTIATDGSLHCELNRRIGKASTTMGRLYGRVWNNGMLSVHTKVSVYQACILSVLLYGSESWATYSWQEKKLNSFHMRCLRNILGITWQDRITNEEVLQRSQIYSIYSILLKRRMRWLGHVHRMSDERIPKYILYGELTEGTRPVGRPKLRFSDVCKRDMKFCNINIETWQDVAVDRDLWRTTVRLAVETSEAGRVRMWREARERRAAVLPASVFICGNCGRDCHARIGLLSHSRVCVPD